MSIYHDLPFEQYLKLPGLNSSSFKDFVKSPVLFAHNRSNPKKTTEAFKFGHLMHHWVLERDSFYSQYAFLPEDVIKDYKKFADDPKDISLFEKAPEGITRKQRNAWKELQSYTDKILLPEKEYDEHFRMWNLYQKIEGRDVWPNEIQENLENFDLKIEGQNELTIQFNYKGVKCKARLDALVGDTIWDVKTSANVYKFERDISGYQYYIQAAFYWIAYTQVMGKEPLSFKFLAIPNKMPYGDFKIFEMHPEYIEYGIDLIDNYIEEYKKCVEENRFERRDKEELVYKPAYL